MFLRERIQRLMIAQIKHMAQPKNYVNDNTSLWLGVMINTDPVSIRSTHHHIFGDCFLDRLDACEWDLLRLSGIWSENISLLCFVEDLSFFSFNGLRFICFIFAVISL